MGSAETDVELLARCAVDPAVFGELYERHGVSVRRYVLSRVGALHGEDLAAEVFIRAFRDRARCRAVQGSALPWLLGVANHVIGDHRRWELRRLRTLEQLVLDHPINAVDQDVGLGPEVVRALRRLWYRARHLSALESVTPCRQDAGDNLIRGELEREISTCQTSRRSLARRRVRVGGLAIPSLAVLTFLGTAVAAAAATALSQSATGVFRVNPQGLMMNGDIEKVLPSTVRRLATADIPGYGLVAVWGASTRSGGFCFAMKLPDDDWGGLHLSQDATDGWIGGSIPGCFQTRQQHILRQTPLRPGQQPSAAAGQELQPLAIEEGSNQVRTSHGRDFTIDVGYVEAHGDAAAIRDARTGESAPVLAHGDYVLVEPGTPNPGNLQVLDRAGQRLGPDYSWGRMLAGYPPGSSQR